VLRSGSQFRAPKPPALSSKEYADAYAEVKAYGGDVLHTDTARTPEQAVRAALVAVSRDRARVVPGPLLCVSIALALMVPFFITREVLRALRNKL
jgi:hypothetical protein